MEFRRLERKQRHVDKKAAILEKELRNAIKSKQSLVVCYIVFCYFLIWYQVLQLFQF